MLYLQNIYGQVQFPAVTFCNLNPVRASKVSLAGEQLTSTLNSYERAVDRQLTSHKNSSSPGRKKRDTIRDDDSSPGQTHTIHRETDTGPLTDRHKDRQTDWSQEHDEIQVNKVELKQMRQNNVNGPKRRVKRSQILGQFHLFF